MPYKSVTGSLTINDEGNEDKAFSFLKTRNHVKVKGNEKSSLKRVTIFLFFSPKLHRTPRFVERRVSIQWRINLYEALFQYLSVSYQRETEEI